jgi:hypothetical protein
VDGMAGLPQGVGSMGAARSDGESLPVHHPEQVR